MDKLAEENKLKKETKKEDLGLKQSQKKETKETKLGLKMVQQQKNKKTDNDKHGGIYLKPL